MGAKERPPNDVYILITQTHAYVPFCGRRHFSGVIQVRVLTWQVVLDSLGGLVSFTRGRRGRARGDMAKEA